MRLSFSGGTIGLQIMAAALVVAACLQIGVLLKSEDAERVARSIEHKRDLDSAFVARMADRALDEAAGRGCQSAGVKANISILLKHLDTMGPGETLETRIAALQNTRDAIDRALACLPTDGNLWLRRAMIGFALQDRLSVIRNDMLLSQRYSPAEVEVLFGRYAFWSRLPKLQLAASASLVMTDIAAICSQKPMLWRVPDPSPILKSFLQERASAVTNCLISGERARRERPFSTPLARPFSNIRCLSVRS